MKLTIWTMKWRPSQRDTKQTRSRSWSSWRPISQRKCSKTRILKPTLSCSRVAQMMRHSKQTTSPRMSRGTWFRIKKSKVSHPTPIWTLSRKGSPWITEKRAPLSHNRTTRKQSKNFTSRRWERISNKTKWSSVRASSKIQTGSANSNLKIRM